jgi:hypothetical protein
MRKPPEFRPRIQRPHESDLLTVAEASEYLRVKRGTLNEWRKRIVGRGPRYIKVHPHLVLYRLRDLVRFLASRVVDPRPKLKGPRKAGT